MSFLNLSCRFRLAFFLRHPLPTARNNNSRVTPGAEDLRRTSRRRFSHFQDRHTKQSASLHSASHLPAWGISSAVDPHWLPSDALPPPIQVPREAFLDAWIVRDKQQRLCWAMEVDDLHQPEIAFYRAFAYLPFGIKFCSQVLDSFRATVRLTEKSCDPRLRILHDRALAKIALLKQRIEDNTYDQFVTQAKQNEFDPESDDQW